jgi:hypothetical protein
MRVPRVAYTMAKKEGQQSETHDTDQSTRLRGSVTGVFLTHFVSGCVLMEAGPCQEAPPLQALVSGSSAPVVGQSQ